jgi:hypothetical protein
VRKDTLHIFNERVQKLKDKYGIVGELKWSKIKNSAGQANICIELLANGAQELMLLSLDYRCEEPVQQLANR